MSNRIRPSRRDNFPALDAWRETLLRQGWLHLPAFQVPPDHGQLAAALTRALGTPFRRSKKHPSGLTITTSPSSDSRMEEPFNRLKAIGWHNDFSTHRVRPRWSLSFIEAQDVNGGGSWRVVNVRDVVTTLQSDHATLSALTEALPYSVDRAGRAISWYRPFTKRGLRFYAPAIRDGCKLAYGKVPLHVRKAIEAVTSAADKAGVTLAAETGTLLVVDNGWAMHDRLPQAHGVRRAILTFACDRPMSR